MCDCGTGPHPGPLPDYGERGPDHLASAAAPNAEQHQYVTDVPAKPDLRPDRDLRIDFFRGIALLAIALNHTVPPPALLDRVGHYQFGHVFAFTFAEVFVSLSGFVCGMAYLRTLETHGLAATWWKAIKRCAVIWLTTVAALLLTWASMWVLQRVVTKPYALAALQFDTSTLWTRAGIIGALKLSPPYWHFNILQFYVVLLLVMPLGLWLAARAKWVLLAISVLLWAGINVAWKAKWVTESFAAGPFGNYLAWQLYFFVGLMLGVMRKRGALRVSMNATVAALLVGVLIFDDALRQLQFAHHHLSDKVHAGPLNVLELLAVATLIAWAMPAQPTWLQRGFPAVIRRLGTRSLTVFAFVLLTCYVFTHLAAILNVGPAGYLSILIAHVAVVLGASAAMDRIAKPRDA